MNAIPDAGTVSFAAQGQSPGTGLAFSNYSGCQSIAPGSTTFTVSQSGSGTTLVSLPAQQLVGGRDYTIVAVGTAANPSYMVLTDTFTTPATNRALLRVVNAIPSTTTTGAVDVFVAAPLTPLGTANQTAVAYRNVFPFLTVPAGTAANQVWLTNTGTTAVIATSAALSLANGEAANLIFAEPGSSTNASFLVPTCQ